MTQGKRQIAIEEEGFKVLGIQHFTLDGDDPPTDIEASFGHITRMTSMHKRSVELYEDFRSNGTGGLVGHRMTGGSSTPNMVVSLYVPERLGKRGFNFSHIF